MAKKTKEAPAKVEASAKVEAPAKVNETDAADAAPKEKGRKSTGDNDVFTRAYGEDGKPTTTDKKLPPQAKLIVNVIEAAGEDGQTRADLVSKLIPAGLVTKQPPGRILSYYQKLITAETGLCTLKVATPSK